MILSNIHSIRKRLIAIILFICIITIGTGFIITTILDIRRIKSNLADQASISAKLVGKSCVSALTFDYPQTAAKNLKALESFPGMVNAWLFDSKGNLFASYDTTDQGVSSLSGALEKSYHYDGGILEIREPIIYQDIVYGMLILKISPEIKAQILSRIIIAAVLFCILFLLAFFLASFFQKLISAPILKLAQTSMQISDKADYHIRLLHTYKGEIGTLYDSFNNMLEAIEFREKERDVAQTDLLFKEQVIESSTSAVVTTDLNGIVTYTNPAFMKLFGYLKVTNVVGKPFSVFLKNNNTFKLMLSSLARQRDWTHETHARRKDGSCFDSIVSADTIFNKESKPGNFVITVSDIVELRETTRELEKENFLKTGVQSITDNLRGVHEISDLSNNLLKGLKRYVNFQVGAAYIPDNNNLLYLQGSYALSHDPAFKDHFEPGEGIAGQAAIEKQAIHVTDVPEHFFKITSGSGQAVPNNIIAIPLIYDDEVMGVLELGSFKEFTPLDLKLLERLNESIAIAIHSSKNNEHLQKLLEKTQAQSEELLSQTEELQAQQEELQQTNEELEEQTQILEEQQIDIKKKNKELEKSSWLVEQKARDLEIISRYKSEFMANMSHELRTPLNSILLLSDVLSNNKEKNLSEKQINFAQNIYASGTDLLALINSILDLSKVESGKMELFLEEVELSEFKETAERTFEQVADKKSIDFSVDIDKNLPSQIITDKQKTEQILNNLLSNAIKFTAEGSVSLSIKRPRKNARDLPKNMPYNQTIAFIVSDTGIGIPKDKTPIIFEAFKQVDGTTSRKYGGTGLGLTISKEISKLLGGSIGLKSEPGKGTTFTLYLPDILERTETVTVEELEEGIEKPIEAPEAPKPAPDQVDDQEATHLPDIFENESCVVNDDRYTITYEDRSVLIIEDDPGFAKILCDHAHEQGFKVIVSNDGEGGLHLADFYRPSAIILDLGLPGIDGWAVMDRLKNNLKTRHIPIHIISFEKIKRKALKMGAVGFLSKPVSLENLEKVFGNFKTILSKPVSKVLVVEDNEEQCQSIKNIIGNNDVKVTCTYSAKDAETLIRSNEFDCLILDLNLPDTSGFELLDIIEKDETLSSLPVIVYTEGELDTQEKEKLKKYAQSIIVKSVDSPERLLDETTLFLHRVETNLSESNRQILRQLYEKESVLKNKKILLVDDDMRNVFALNNILEDKGLNILVAKTGIEALSRLDENPDTHMVLMDIMMPEMDGYEAMQEIRKQARFEELPIIALTAKAMKGDRAKCIEAGANDYLSKPVDREKLLSMIRVWLY